MAERISETGQDPRGEEGKDKKDVSGWTPLILGVSFRAGTGSEDGDELG